MRALYGRLGLAVAAAVAVTGLVAPGASAGGAAVTDAAASPAAVMDAAASPAAVTGRAATAAAPSPADVDARQVVAELDAAKFEIFPASPDDAVASDAVISADGQHVAFVRTGPKAGVYLSSAARGDDPFARPPVLVSAAQAGGDSREPSVSADGRFVAFTSDAPVETGGSLRGIRHVYVRDLERGVTVRVAADAEPDGDARSPQLSGDGRTLVFESDATNLVPGDVNGAPDVFVADLDPDGDGQLGEVSLRLAQPGVAGGTTDPAISGSGEIVAFVAGGALLAGPVGAAREVAAGASSPALDAPGTAIAFVGTCDGAPAVLAAALDGDAVRVLPIGTAGVDRRWGEVADPALSADATTLAWTSTQPRTGGGAERTAPLREPVVRLQRLAWAGARSDGACAPQSGRGWLDLAAGTGSSLSATGRTVAYDAAGAAADRSVFAADTHSNDGLAVTTTASAAPVPGLATSVDAAGIADDAPPSALDPRSADAAGGTIAFRYAFDAGPGEDPAFSAATATLELPAGTRLLSDGIGDGPADGIGDGLQAAGAGPGIHWSGAYAGAVREDTSLLRLPLGDVAAGTVVEVRAAFSASTLAAPTRTAARLDAERAGVPLHADTWLAATAASDPDDDGVLAPGRVAFGRLMPDADADRDATTDEDAFRVAAPQPGQRLVITVNPAGGALRLRLAGTPSGASALGIPSSSAGLPEIVLAETIVPAGVVSELALPATDAVGAGELVLRVTSPDGRPSRALYSLRADYRADAPETVCAPYAPPPAPDDSSDVAPDDSSDATPEDDALGPFSEIVPAPGDPITAATDTLYLVDARRFDQLHGPGSIAAVRAALAQLDGAGAVRAGAVVTVDESAAVRAARAGLDANPCSLSARERLVAAITAYVAGLVEEAAAPVASVVVLGGDDVIPFAPVRFAGDEGETAHAADLRRATPRDAGSCQSAVPAGQVDACATPLSAMFAAGVVLSDDPYALPTADVVEGAFRYTPTVAIGRLVESPEQLIDAAQRFVAADGLLPAASALVASDAGHRALADLVARTLGDRAPVTRLTEWDAAALDDAVFAGGVAPGLVALLSGGDERRLRPSGSEAAADAFTAASIADPTALGSSLVIATAPHAGVNLPSSDHGPVDDWADVFGSAAGFVGSTGTGRSDVLGAAYDERLLAAFVAAIGIADVTAGDALRRAKTGFGASSAADLRALAQTVYYGLPMYAFADAAAPPAPPPVPDTLAPIAAIGDGLAAASVSLTPAFAPHTAFDGAGGEVEYVTASIDGTDAAGGALRIAPGEPVLPQVLAGLAPAPPGMAARGVLVTGLTSRTGTLTRPAVAAPTDLAGPAAGTVRAPSSPTGIAEVRPGPGGDVLVVHPAHVAVQADGRGSIERVTAIDLDVLYGPADADDLLPPRLLGLAAPGAGESGFVFRADGTGSELRSATLLVQPAGDPTWQRIEATPPALGDDRWTIAYAPVGAYRWILQLVDAAGNVATDTAGLAGAALPAPGIAGETNALTTPAGESVDVRLGVTGTGAGITAEWTLYGTGDAVVDSGIGTIETGDDGRAAAAFALTPRFPGRFWLVLSVCRAGACTDRGLAVTVGERTGQAPPSPGTGLPE